MFFDVRGHCNLDVPKEHSWIYGGLRRVYSCLSGHRKNFTMIMTVVHHGQKLENRVPDVFRDGMTLKELSLTQEIHPAKCWPIVGVDFNRFWNEYQGETLFSLDLDLCWILVKIWLIGVLAALNQGTTLRNSYTTSRQFIFFGSKSTFSYMTLIVFFKKWNQFDKFFIHLRALISI